MSERNSESENSNSTGEIQNIAEDDQWLYRLRVVRELWFLREQARVRAVGQEFLQRLERVVVSKSVYIIFYILRKHLWCCRENMPH